MKFRCTEKYYFTNLYLYCFIFKNLKYFYFNFLDFVQMLDILLSNYSKMFFKLMVKFVKVLTKFYIISNL